MGSVGCGSGHNEASSDRRLDLPADLIWTDVDRFQSMSMSSSLSFLSLSPVFICLALPPGCRHRLLPPRLHHTHTHHARARTHATPHLSSFVLSFTCCTLAHARTRCACRHCCCTPAHAFAFAFAAAFACNAHTFPSHLYLLMYISLYSYAHHLFAFTCIARMPRGTDGTILPLPAYIHHLLHATPHHMRARAHGHIVSGWWMLWNSWLVNGSPDPTRALTVCG